ncbi:restriction endonuclease subunit S [Aerococcus suis]|uniref:Type I restriction enzyme, S subunit n=1 Tax=Aerococcus suis TaxID=371602 RepID=A0A1W1YEY3_9LACT|nr:restriction endonuclease subunit S [Aerococcus suis]SMC34717.1 type I restriction enzyme, S subunit [Aerococcus suis]
MSINKDSQKAPNLRFKGFTDDWEQRKLGEVSDVRDGTHASPKYVNQGHPMVTSKNLTSSGLDMTDVSFLTDEDFNEINKRSKVSIGDILFGMIGTIGNPVIVDRADFAIKNVALIKEKSYNPIMNRWLLQYLKSPSFNRFIQKENAGGTQKFIALGLIRDMILKVPGLEEQQKIGTFLRQIDNTITLHQRKLDQLKQLKEALLQQMFPGKGETVPKLRFAGFEGDWEEWKLKDVSEMYDNLRVPVTASDRIPGETPYYGANGIQDYVKDYTHIGEFVLIAEDGANDLVNYPVHYVTGEVWVNNHAHVISAMEGKLDNLFLVSRLKSMNFIPWLVGGGRAKLNGDVLKKLPIIIPHLEEQQKIGSFFKHLDNTISGHQRKLDQLQNMKQVLLQNMFI